MRRKVILQRSENGQIHVFDRRDDFIASFKDGKWVGDLLFNSYELEEFDLIEDEAEIEHVLAMARAALNQPMKQSSDDKAKSA